MKLIQGFEVGELNTQLPKVFSGAVITVGKELDKRNRRNEERAFLKFSREIRSKRIE